METTNKRTAKEIMDDYLAECGVNGLTESDFFPLYNPAGYEIGTRAEAEEMINEGQVLRDDQYNFLA